MNAEQILQKLKDILEELFEVDPASVKMETRIFEELDIDSIDAVDLVIKLKEFTGKKILPEQFKSVRTVEDVVVLVAARKGAPSYNNILPTIPAKLEKYFFDKSRIIIYP